MEFAATGERSWRVQGLFDNKSLVQSDYLLAIPTYEAHFPEKVDLQVFVKVADGVKRFDRPQGNREACWTSTRPESGEPGRRRRRSRRAQVNQLLGMVTAMLGLALVIALFGITNTLALSVFERTRELGLLRAVGMSRRQTRRMIRWEAVIISIIGAVLGLAIGLFFGWALVKSLEEGRDLRAHHPLRTAAGLCRLGRRGRRGGCVLPGPPGFPAERAGGYLNRVAAAKSP